MNFYILIFKNEIKAFKWVFLLIITIVSLSLALFSINYIVDPYNITKQNILNIKYKFASDDREEKVKYFTTKNNVDNILIGSSRVYSINPNKLNDFVDGKSYNFGVGTATVEDHYGIIKYLLRKKKLPKRLFIGLDFYTFNKNFPLNKYFLRNEELNFLSYLGSEDNYFSKFFSIDSTLATIKTIRYNFRGDKKPRFDDNGWLIGRYLDYTKIDIDKENLQTNKEIKKELKTIYSNFIIDKKRLYYYKQIEKIANDNKMELYLFTTPLNPLLLKKLEENKETRSAMNEFIEYFSTFANFRNLYYDKDIYGDIRNFQGATHTTKNAGDLILKKIFEEKE